MVIFKKSLWKHRKYLVKLQTNKSFDPIEKSKSKKNLHPHKIQPKFLLQQVRVEMLMIILVSSQKQLTPNILGGSVRQIGLVYIGMH